MPYQIRRSQQRSETRKKEQNMLHYTVVFLVLALIAAVFGFGGVAVAAAGIAKILFFLFLIGFVISLLMGRRSV
jgi:uncharacterized membrane protein YtjA (UPF0391 family)